MHLEGIEKKFSLFMDLIVYIIESRDHEHADPSCLLKTY